MSKKQNLVLLKKHKDLLKRLDHRSVYLDEVALQESLFKKPQTPWEEEHNFFINLNGKQKNEEEFDIYDPVFSSV